MASASSDEGEIIESVSAEDGKAASSSLLPLRAAATGAGERNGVDRQDRPRRGFSQTPQSPPEGRDAGRHGSHDSRRSRSPARGHKRSRDEERDHRDPRDRGGGGGRGRQGGGPDNRRFRVHYEDPRGDFRRNRVSYEDLDRPPSRTSNLDHAGRERDRSRDRFNDRDRTRDRDRDRNHNRDRDREPDSGRDRDGYPDKRARHRSRSPYNPRRGRGGGGGDRRRDDRPSGGGRGERGFDRYRDDARAVKYEDYHNDRNPLKGGPAFRRAAQEGEGHGPRASRKEDAKPGKGHADEPKKSQPAAMTTKSEPETAYEEPVDEDAEIERRRRRREALLAKSSSATPLLVHAVTSTERSNVSSPNPARQATPQREVSTPASAPSPASTAMNDGLSPDDETGVLNDNDLINTHGNVGGTDEDGPSAADYDPTNDMREDGRRHEMRTGGNAVLHGEVVEGSVDGGVGAQGDDDKASAKETGGGSKDDDDDDFNMFAEDFADKYSSTCHPADEEAAPDCNGAGGGLLDGQDKDGYYKVRIGEVLNGRYQVQSSLGKGMFSGVVRATDMTTKKLVAIKMMRNNDALRKGGFTEIAILQKLNESDPDGRKHIVRFHRHFDHKGHLCMAFENLSLNLREVLKKFGNNVGINLGATRAYAHQILVALAHMRRCAVIHADLKPDNILVSESRTTLKICDLGTAIDRHDASSVHPELTPYLVSRFYRAPEIILGIPYDYAIDMWSIGCTLYELYTGKILFTGDSNNQMLRAIMEIRGKMTNKMYKRGQLAGVHFDEKGNFVSVERDKILNKTSVKTYAVIKPTRDLRTRLMAASEGMSDAETRDLNLFVDLLEHCLALNPDKRIKPADALKHPFFTARGAAPATSKVVKR